MDFQAIYNIKDEIKHFKKKKQINFIELKPHYSFSYKMFDMDVNVGKENQHKGYSWCGGICRWGTTDKIKTIEKYCKGSVEYVGIAVDEQHRLIKERNGYKKFPLAEMRMTEKDCLKYCYENGFNWLEDGVDLYSILDRVSCWCCANKNLKELRNYYLYLPTYWNKLKELQSKTDRPFKYNKYTVFDLEKKFMNEKRINKQIKSWENTK